MADLPVLYCDGFELQLSPFGALLRFGARLPLPNQGQAGPAQQPSAFVEAARIGTGLSHIKVMAAVLVREVLRHEATLKGPIQVPAEVVQQLGFGPGDWERFWGVPPKQEVLPSVTPGAGAMALAPR